MIKEEAYNAMSQGYKVTHKLFNPDEYLYMDESFIIKTEKDMTFESEWDIKSDSEWLVDWYIYKNTSSPFNKKIKNSHFIPKKIEKKNNFITHQIGHMCPGEDMCEQYNKLSEYACTICDVNLFDETDENNESTSVNNFDNNMFLDQLMCNARLQKENHNHYSDLKGVMNDKLDYSESNTIDQQIIKLVEHKNINLKEESKYILLRSIDIIIFTFYLVLVSLNYNKLSSIEIIICCILYIFWMIIIHIIKSRKNKKETK